MGQATMAQRAAPAAVRDITDIAIWPVPQELPARVIKAGILCPIIMAAAAAAQAELAAILIQGDPPEAAAWEGRGCRIL